MPKHIRQKVRIVDKDSLLIQEILKIALWRAENIRLKKVDSSYEH